jgi:hypothetical protein
MRLALTFIRLTLTRAGSGAGRILLWLAALIDRRTFALNALRLAQRRAPAVFAEFLTDQAAGLAVGLTMQILDREGLAHCALCPSRFRLKKIGGRYACLTHSKEATRTLSPNGAAVSA